MKTKIVDDIISGLTEALSWVRGEKKLKVIKYITCDECNGHGTSGPFAGLQLSCHKCKGAGRVRRG
jgi:DnaJ-class molecular chaperone